MSVSTIYSMHVNKRFFPKQDHDEVLSEEETSHYIKSAMELISPEKKTLSYYYMRLSHVSFFSSEAAGENMLITSISTIEELEALKAHEFQS